MEIQKIVLEKFQQIYQKKNKKKFDPKNSSTVLASLIIRSKTTQQLKIISLATGTKSLPMELVLKYRESILSDMHAQVLARKSFILFLKNWINNKLLNSDLFEQLFLKDLKRNKFYFNTQKYELILYSTQVPCGDCSINEQSMNITGAKPLSQLFQQYKPQTIYKKYILRTKPGRLDLPRNKRSCSLSCSDKIMTWNILGIQGKKMFNYFLPIYVDRIIIQCQKKQYIKVIQQSLDINYRLRSLFDMSQELIKKKLFYILIQKKLTKFTYQFKLKYPKIQLIQKKFISSQNKVKTLQTSLIYSYNSFLEECNGHTGLRHGSSIKNIAKLVGISQLSSKLLYENIQQFQKNYQYKAVKDRIKLIFGEWVQRDKIKL